MMLVPTLLTGRRQTLNIPAGKAAVAEKIASKASAVSKARNWFIT
jgi:hypothetical protein